MIEIVSATRLSESDFWSKSALGISLRRFAKDQRLIARITFKNTRGLSVVFNERIDAQEDARILVFIHDDVWIDDDAFVDVVIDGLKSFDIIGVAGNRRKVKNQPAWAFVDENLTWDDKENLSGSVAHGKYPFGNVSKYGAPPAECELLDGVFLAASKTKLNVSDIRFDTRFDFHFYDLDFCRSARSKGLRLGTWPIQLTHQSGGAFGSSHWLDNYQIYKEKWELGAGHQHLTRTTVSSSDLAASLFSANRIFQRLSKLFFKSQKSGNVNPAAMPLDFPGEYASYKKLGNEYLAKGDLDNAADCYAHMVAVNPKSAEGFLNLGFVLLTAQINLQDAERYLKQAILINPDLDDAYYLLGTILQGRGNFAGAIENFSKTLELKPDFELAYRDLCHVLIQGGHYKRASSVVENGLSLYPESGDLHCFQGNLYIYEQKPELAVACYQKALTYLPHNVMVHANMGKAFFDQGNTEEAAKWYREALELDPDSIESNSCLLFIQSFQTNYSTARYLEEARHYGRKVLALAQPYAHWANHPSDGDKQPLRVGLVSGDLINHPVGFFLESILAHLNPAKVVLVAYPTQREEDSLTARIKPRFAAWHPIVDLSDEAAARKIHEDGIHILIDLAGHTTHNRLPVFAWRPAPVQAAWLGYFASTGVPGIDYLLADPISVPESHRDHFTETVCYLPDTRLCFTPPGGSKMLLPSPPPVICNGFITFGCFQNVRKINDDVLAAWGKIFNSLPHARLRLQSKQMNSPSARENLLERLAGAGIGRERATIGTLMSRTDYLAAHAEVDILLDTFPYPGGTTTCEAMWMGVPTLTLAGDTLLSRQGASMLTCAGLGEWVAVDEGDYVARALSFASDVDRLVQLRSGLREQVLASPLFDAPRFARHLEDALQDMWRNSPRLKS